jgi:sortase A
VTSAELSEPGRDVVTFAPPGADKADMASPPPDSPNGHVPDKPPVAPAKAPAKAASRAWDGAVRSVGVSLTLLAVAILSFVGYLYFLSGVQEARAQTTLYARMQGELAQAVAPTGPMIPGHPASPASLAAVPGDPIALLDIPAIGISNMVIVEGTSPENLTLGPGHLRDTPFPGQAGISVVFGRRETFGGPFGNLPQLRKGDVITTTTGQGQARYQVIALSDSSKPVPFSEIPNQILLVTADSRIAPAHYIEVEAKLLGSPFPESGYVPVVGPSEVALGRDPYALIPAMVWAIALAAAALTGSFLAGRWSRWPAWIVTISAIIAILWNLFESLSALLPNLY